MPLLTEVTTCYTVFICVWHSVYLTTVYGTVPCKQMMQYRNKENYILFRQWSNGMQHWWEGYRQLQRYNVHCTVLEVQRLSGVHCSALLGYWGRYT